MPPSPRPLTMATLALLLLVYALVFFPALPPSLSQHDHGAAFEPSAASTPSRPRPSAFFAAQRQQTRRALQDDAQQPRFQAWSRARASLHDFASTSPLQTGVAGCVAALAARAAHAAFDAQPLTVDYVPSVGVVYEAQQRDDRLRALYVSVFPAEQWRDFLQAVHVQQQQQHAEAALREDGTGATPLLQLGTCSAAAEALLLLLPRGRRASGDARHAHLAPLGVDTRTTSFVARTFPFVRPLRPEHMVYIGGRADGDETYLLQQYGRTVGAVKRYPQEEAGRLRLQAEMTRHLLRVPLYHMDASLVEEQGHLFAADNTLLLRAFRPVDHALPLEQLWSDVCSRESADYAPAIEAVAAVARFLGELHAKTLVDLADAFQLSDLDQQLWVSRQLIHSFWNDRHTVVRASRVVPEAVSGVLQTLLATAVAASHTLPIGLVHNAAGIQSFLVSWRSGWTLAGVAGPSLWTCSAGHAVPPPHHNSSAASPSPDGANVDPHGPVRTCVAPVNLEHMSTNSVCLLDLHHFLLSMVQYMAQVGIGAQVLDAAVTAFNRAYDDVTTGSGVERSRFVAIEPLFRVLGVAHLLEAEDYRMVFPGLDSSTGRSADDSGLLSVVKSDRVFYSTIHSILAHRRVAEAGCHPNTIIT